MTTQRKTTPILHLKLIERAADPAGFSASEITGYGAEQVRNAAEALVKAARIVRCKISPRRVRYFLNDAGARTYQARPARPATSASDSGPRFKARWSADEPAIITARTKIIIAPPLPRNVYRTATYAQF